MDFSPVIDYIESVLIKEKGVPGCDLRIMRNHQQLLRYTTGVSDYEGKKPLSQDALYFMYSCTKPVTCAAALQLVERGVIGLDDPVIKYLPAYKNAYLLKNGEKVAPTSTMTIRHLFTMSGGLDYDYQGAHILKAAAQPGAGTVDIVNAFVEKPLLFEPGERFFYSLCHDVLAAIVEVASGIRFSEYLKKNIFEPLGMNRTGFRIPDSQRPSLVAQYECNEAGELRPYPQETGFAPNPNYDSGGAGLYSCLEDYSRFADAMANGGIGCTGAQILRPETIDLMRSEQLSSYLMDNEFSCAGGPGYGYGLGVRTLIDKSEGQRSALGEFGWDGAAGSYLLMDPTHGLSITFTMHVRGWPALIGFGHIPLRDLTYQVLGL